MGDLKAVIERLKAVTNYLLMVQDFARGGSNGSSPTTACGRIQILANESITKLQEARDALHALQNKETPDGLSPDDVEKAAIAAHEYQHIMPWQKITQGRRIMTRERTIASLRAIGFEVQTDGGKDG